MANCYLETHEGTEPWHPAEFEQIKNGYFSFIIPTYASILSAFRTQFWINICPFQNTTFESIFPLFINLFIYKIGKFFWLRCE